MDEIEHSSHLLSLLKIVMGTELTYLALIKILDRILDEHSSHFLSSLKTVKGSSLLFALFALGIKIWKGVRAHFFSFFTLWTKTWKMISSIFCAATMLIKLLVKQRRVLLFHRPILVIQWNGTSDLVSFTLVKTKSISLVFEGMSIQVSFYPFSHWDGLKHRKRTILLSLDS